MDKFENLRILLGDNYIPENELTVIDIGDLLSTIGPLLKISSSDNFSKTAMATIEELIVQSDSIESNVKRLQQALRQLHWPVKKKDLDLLAKSGVKYTREDVVYIKTNVQITGMPGIVWLEIGNAKSGLIHMLYYSTEQESKKGDKKGHLQNLMDYIIGLKSFDDLFDVFDLLLEQPDIKVSQSKVDKPSLIINVKNSLKRNHVIIKPCCYNIPIGENGFIVSAYMSGGRQVGTAALLLIHLTL